MQGETRGEGHAATETAERSELAAHYQSCWDAVAARKWTEVGACYSDDITETTLGMPSISGKSAVLADHQGWSTAFPDATFDPQLTLVSGHDVFSVRWFRGTHTGALKLAGGDVAATHKKVSMLVLDHAQLGDAGLIVHEWFVIDPGTLMFQLGQPGDPGRAPLDAGWPGAPIVVVAQDNEVEHANAMAMKRLYDSWNKRDMKQLYSMSTDDAVESNNSEPKDVDKKGVEDENTMLLAAFTDNHMDLDGVWAAGDYTVAFEHFRGTNDGDLGPIKKTGKKLDWPMIEIIKWRDGKLRDSWPFVNGTELATQLGLGR